MTNIRDVNIVRGSVFDLAHLLSLDDGDCNVIVVSSRTLSLIQTLGNDEVSFAARYASQFLDGNRYVIADTDSDLDDINDIVNLYRLEVNDLTCDLVAALQDIVNSLSTIAQAGCGSCGSEVDQTSEDTPPVGPTEPWEDFDEYDTYKCKGANWILDGLTDLVDKLRLYDVDFWTTASVASAAALFTSVVLSTLFGGWIFVVAGAIIGIVTKLIIGTTIDLTDIKTVLVNDRSDLICALYNGTSAESSRSAFVAAADTAGLNSAEAALLGLILTTSVLNQLYEFNSEIDAYTGTTSCASCAGQPCPYTVVRGTGTPTYDQQAFVMSSVPYGGNQEVNLQAGTACGNGGQGNWCLQFDATNITNPESTYQRALWCKKSSSTTGTKTYPGAFPPLSTDLLVQAMQFISQTPFTVTITINAQHGYCAADPEDGCP